MCDKPPYDAHHTHEGDRRVPWPVRGFTGILFVQVDAAEDYGCLRAHCSSCRSSPPDPKSSRLARISPSRTWRSSFLKVGHLIFPRQLCSCCVLSNGGKHRVQTDLGGGSQSEDRSARPAAKHGAQRGRFIPSLRRVRMRVHLGKSPPALAVL
jgi:hypothetical protein